MVSYIPLLLIGGKVNGLTPSCKSQYNARLLEYVWSLASNRVRCGNLGMKFTGVSNCLHIFGKLQGSPLWYFSIKMAECPVKALLKSQGLSECYPSDILEAHLRLCLKVQKYLFSDVQFGVWTSKIKCNYYHANWMLGGI